MSTFSEQISSNKAVIRFDVVGGPERTAVAEDMSFLNYRLGSVEVSHEITKEQPRHHLVLRRGGEVHPL